MNFIRVFLFFSAVSHILSKPTKGSTDISVRGDIESLNNKPSISFTQESQSNINWTEVTMTTTQTTRRKILCGTICKLHEKLIRIFDEMDSVDSPWNTNMP